MLRASACVAFAAALLTVGCNRAQLSPDEEKIVGTWEFSGMHFTNRVVFRRDHTTEELFMREDGLLAKISPWAVMSRGTWRLEGDTIVIDEQTVVGPEPRRRRVFRTKILEFRPDELVRDGRSPFKRVK